MHLIGKVDPGGDRTAAFNGIGVPQHGRIVDVTPAMPGIDIRVRAIDDPRVRRANPDPADEVEVGSNSPAAFLHRQVVFHLPCDQDVPPRCVAAPP